MRAMAPPKKLLVRVIVTLVALGVVVLLVGAGWVSSLYQSEQTDEAHASKAFAEVRARFLGLKPALEIQDTQLVIVREPAAPRSATPTVAHVLVWQPRERILSRATLPLWLSKIATEPLPLDALAGIGKQGLGALMDAKRRGNELNIRISDLERYGQTLLLDGVTADGKQVMIWNE
jgi:hypothetical protein